jgi:hypothetical protein
MDTHPLCPPYDGSVGRGTVVSDEDENEDVEHISIGPLIVRTTSGGH